MLTTTPALEAPATTGVWQIDSAATRVEFAIGQRWF